MKNLQQFAPIGGGVERSPRAGFTLAEVLITLGIIGVVAAMTIPTLVANYQAKSWNTSAQVFERKLEEALKTMNTQQTLSGFSTTEEFVAELSKHLKISKICKNDELMSCFEDKVYWGGGGEATPEEVDMTIVKTAKNFGQNDWGTNIVGIQVANGTNALIAYNPTDTCTQDPYSNQITGDNCLAILYDTSAFKNPNTSGKDLRSNGNVARLGRNCFAIIDSLCIATSAFIPSPYAWNACSTEGTTTDPEDLAFMAKYNIDTCQISSKTDYWAGAIKTCDEQGLKLASDADLAKIANYIYNTSGISDGSSKYELTRDDTKAAALGFNFNQDYSSQFVWVYENNTTYSPGKIAYTRAFVEDGTNKSTSWRYDPKTQAICVSN